MRVSPGDLSAARGGRFRLRYALLGPVAYVRADIPAGGAAGTGIDRPCTDEHHGLVLAGTLVLHRPGQATVFEERSAFYVRPGEPAHWFESRGPAIVGGFAETGPDVDTSLDALRRLGLEVDEPSDDGPFLGPEISLGPGASRSTVKGDVMVESALMGSWLLSRATFGPASGFGGGWCDLRHWGLVLDGELAVHFADHAELISAGDVYYLPPGHSFEIADGATILDYTPITAIEDAPRVSAWRRPSIRDLLGQGSNDAREADSIANAGEGVEIAPISSRG